jgi:hypothetical protein
MLQMMGRWGKKEDRNSPVGAWFVIAREAEAAITVDDPNAFMNGPPFVADLLAANPVVHNVALTILN